MEPSKAKICVPVCAGPNELNQSIACAAEIGDLIELRLDCLPEDKRESAWRELVASTSHTIILTLRPGEQGGKDKLSLKDRLQFWSSIENAREGVMFDLELDVITDALANKTLDASRHFPERPEAAGRQRQRVGDSDRARVGREHGFEDVGS